MAIIMILGLCCSTAFAEEPASEGQGTESAGPLITWSDPVEPELDQDEEIAEKDIADFEYDEITVPIPIKGTGTFFLKEMGTSRQFTAKIEKEGILEAKFSEPGTYYFTLYSGAYNETEVFNVTISVFTYENIDKLYYNVMVINDETGLKPGEIAFVPDDRENPNPPQEEKPATNTPAPEASKTPEPSSSSSSGGKTGGSTGTGYYVANGKGPYTTVKTGDNHYEIWIYSVIAVLSIAVFVPLLMRGKKRAEEE